MQLRLDTLPTEIFNQIILDLDHCSLGSLNLASRRLYSGTLSALWTSPTLQLSHKTAWAGLFDVLKRRENLRNCVETFNVFDDRSRRHLIASVKRSEALSAPFYRDSERELADRVWRTARLLPHLKSLVTIAPAGSSELLRSDLVLHRLESLELTHMELGERKLGLVLSRIPSLRQLRLDIVRLIYINEKTFADRDDYFRYFGKTPDVDCEELAEALHSASAKLERLSLSLFLNVVCFDLHTAEMGREGFHFPVRAEGMITSLRRFDRLQNIVLPLELIFEPQWIPDLGGDEKLKKLLPRSLKNLTLTDYANRVNMWYEGNLWIRCLDWLHGLTQDPKITMPDWCTCCMLIGDIADGPAHRKARLKRALSWGMPLELKQRLEQTQSRFASWDIRFTVKAPRVKSFLMEPPSEDE